MLIFVAGNEECDQRIMKLDLTSMLPKYMVPTKYFKVDEFPTNANGKIDRLALKNKYIDSSGK